MASARRALGSPCPALIACIMRKPGFCRIRGETRIRGFWEPKGLGPVASLPCDSLSPHFLHDAATIRSRWGRVRRGYRLSRAGRVGYASPEFPRDCLIRLLEFPELPFRTSTRETIKVEQTTLLVCAELPIDGRMVPVAYKRVRRRNWLKRLTAVLRGNRARRAWRLAQRLERLGIATATPLAAIIPRWELRHPDSFLMTAWVEHSCNLDLRLQAAEESPLAPGDARAAARSLGRLLGRMHACRISHRDLKASNVLVQECANGASARIIDLDGAAVRLRVTRRRRARDLARLAIDLERFPMISRTQKLRFLKAYLASGGRHWDPRDAWRRLESATATLKTRKRKRERP